MKKTTVILITAVLLLTFMITKSINVMQDTEEIWKDVPGYKGRYKVSNLGRFIGQKGVILRQQKSKGYLIISLEGVKKKTTRSSHKIVGVTFVDNPQRKPQLNHINGIKTDNRSVNLEWVTPKENTAHAINSGLRRIDFCMGDGSHYAKLSSDEVLEIREMGDSVSLKELASQYSVTVDTINNVLKRKTWYHI